ncbi:MAG: lytic murein transglycosylase [Deferrisomatales bacterium]
MYQRFAPVLGLAAGLALGAPAWGGTGPFAQWLSGVAAEARAQGVGPATLEAALAGLAPIPRVLELDRRQPEFTLTLAQYRERVAPAARVARGRELLAELGEVLEPVSRRYGVEPRFLVALWAAESDFGRRTGAFPVVGALATLAHDGRRSAFFRRELLAALKILDQGHVALADFTGSWAGATGQCQFMPTSFLEYAADQDGDGRKDIWGNEGDALASAARYLSRHGWQGGRGWGIEAQAPPGLTAKPRAAGPWRPLAEWRRLGVRAAGGGPLPGGDTEATLVRPDGPRGPAFLVYPNYRALLRWNGSDLFALTVGHLADRLPGPPPGPPAGAKEGDP